MEKEKNQELEKILSELNTNMKKTAREEEKAAPEPKKARKNDKSAPEQAETEPVKAEQPETEQEKTEQKTEGAPPAQRQEKADSRPKPPSKQSQAKKTEEPPAPSDSPEAPKEKQEKKERKEERKPTSSQKSKRRGGNRNLREKLEEKTEAAEIFLQEEKSSFLESARMIEEEMADQELKQPAVRHIAVTAAEVIAEEIPEPSKKRRAFDQQKNAGSEPPRLPKRTSKRMNRKEKATVVLGVLVTFFVLVGVISTVFAGVNLASELINSTSKKEELARVIFPLVIVDIPEFESPEALDNAAIVQSSIWAFIIDEEDKSKYPKDDLGAMTVPETDIEPYIRRLYGNDVKIQHQSIDDASVQMLYDSENKRYIIESTPRFLPYTPRVDKISRSGDVYTLRVSYVLPDALWNLEKDHSNATIDKVMEYRLKKSKDSYQMLSVKLLEVTGRSEQGAGVSSQNASQAMMPEEELPLGSVSSGTSSESVSSKEQSTSSSGEEVSSAAEDAD